MVQRDAVRIFQANFDMVKVLKNYNAYEKGYFNQGKSALKVEDALFEKYEKTEPNMVKIADLDNVTESIDSQEEFITAVYYSPIQISPAAQSAIDRELPKGKEGALKLGAMWLKKSVDENTDSTSGKYTKALAIIQEKSGVSQSEILSYYRRSITAEALALGKKHFEGRLSEAELKKAMAPVIAYYTETNPSRRKLHYNGMVAVAKKFWDKDDGTRAFFVASYRNSIKELNVHLAYQVEREATKSSLSNVSSE
ncbi:MAG: hypothetical protein KDK39_14325 [Leptospiraceae bacterium]|nr:hypothetical protein [Leptospiraceae bacterium]